MSINWCLHTQVMYPYKRMLLSNQKKQTTAVYYNMDEPRKIMRKKSQMQKPTCCVIPFQKGKSIAIESRPGSGAGGVEA